jgi:hypothetical protein
VWANHEGFRSFGVFSIGAESANDDPRDLEAAIFEEAARIAEQPPAGAELARIKTRVGSRTVFAQEEVLGIARSLAYYESLGDYRLADTLPARLQAVSPDEIADAAMAILDPFRATIVEYLPRDSVAPTRSVDEVYRAAFRHANVVLTEETEEFFDAIETLTVAGDRRPTAPRVAVITVSGGPSVVAADAAERSGLAVPPLGEAARKDLRALLPSFAAVANPVDLTPHVERRHMRAAVRRVLDEPAIAGAIAVNVGLDVPEFADAFIDAVAATGKPAVSFVVDAPVLEARLQEGGVPVLASPERAVRAWRALWQSRPRAAPSVADHPPRSLPPDLARAMRDSRGPLPYPVARRLLEAYGIRFCREAIAATVDDAVNAAREIGYPVVVKAEAPGLTHKSEAGAVRLDLRDAGAVRDACHDLRARLGTRHFIVQARAGPGVELLIGARRDASFGPLVAVGSGGVLAEVIRDVSFRLAPLDRDEARAMWLEGARPRLLAGPRGLPASDVEPLVDAAVAVGELMLGEPRVLELDLNPVIATGMSALAVDALVIMGDEA